MGKIFFDFNAYRIRMLCNIDYIPCSHSAGQPIPSAGISGGYVLPVPDDSAYHER